jgi:RND family efflux transporter MFP subunit
VKVSAVGDQQFEGEVEEIGVLSNPLSHTYMVKIVLENKDNLLKPGMVCNVNLSNPTLKNRIIIPLSAVQTEDESNLKYVFLANPDTNKAIKSPVTVGSLTTNGVVIADGLSAGDLLITEGYQKINEGSIIQIIR